MGFQDKRPIRPKNGCPYDRGKTKSKDRPVWIDDVDFHRRRPLSAVAYPPEQILIQVPLPPLKELIFSRKSHLLHCNCWFIWMNCVSENDNFELCLSHSRCYWGHALSVSLLSYMQPLCHSCMLMRSFNIVGRRKKKSAFKTTLILCSFI